MKDLDQSLVLIVGAQRSGTTWVQRLLASHPAIVSGQESYLFSSYLGPMWQRWRTEHTYRVNGGRTVGLACYLTEEELLEEMRGLARRILSRQFESKPGTTLVVEKTPDHALHLPLIHRLFPDAVVLHVLRDGRDVSASMMGASQSAWGRNWAPTTAKEAAQRWQNWVRAIRNDLALFPRSRTVRYEELAEDGPNCLAALYEYLGVPLPAEQVAGILQRWSFSACQTRQVEDALLLHPNVSGALLEPVGFHRSGRVGGWRTFLNPEDQQTVEAEAGELLSELGYTASAEPVTAAVTPEPATGLFVSEMQRDHPLWTWPRSFDVIATSNAQMVYRERLFLYSTVLALKPERCLEIGVCDGGSSRIIAAALNDLDAGRLISVDPCLRISPETRAALADRVTFLEAPSPDALSEAEELAGGPFDFVLLDGDHSDTGVFRDLLGLVEVLRPGGIILAHDAYFQPVERGIGNILREGLPLMDAGIVSTTCHVGRQGGERVSFGGFRMLVRIPDESRARRLVRKVTRRLTRKIASLVGTGG